MRYALIALSVLLVAGCGIEATPSDTNGGVRIYTVQRANGTTIECAALFQNSVDCDWP